MSPAWLILVAAWIACYETARLVRVRAGHRWPSWRRTCWWLAALAFVGVWLLVPLGDSEHRLWAETLQYALIAFGAAPLAFQGSPGGLVTHRPPHTLDVLRHEAGKRHLLQVSALVGFLLATVLWRLPGPVDALSRHPTLVVVEAVTVVLLMWPFWLAVAATPPSPLLEHRPARIALAGVAAWSVWTFAYAVGFSGHPFYGAYEHGASPVGGQEWSVLVLWATSALAILPAAFFNLVRWLAADRVVAEAETDLYLRAAAGSRSAARGRKG